MAMYSDPGVADVKPGAREVGRWTFPVDAAVTDLSSPEGRAAIGEGQSKVWKLRDGAEGVLYYRLVDGTIEWSTEPFE